MYTEHNSALMDLSMTAFLAESMTDATTEWNKLHPSYVPILKDVESLIGPNEKFDRFITEFHRLEVSQQAIICRWFRFFTDHHSSCVCIYKAIIQALIELSDSNAELTKLEWEPQDQFSRFEISFGKYQYLFEQLTSGQALAVESEIMNNCVFQFYLTGCAKGWGAIWSMQKKKESGYVKCLTIHVQKTFIVEIAGRSNHKAGRKQMKIVREWARQIGFTVFDDDLYPRVDLAV